MSTHNIGYEDLTKIIIELSSNVIKYALISPDEEPQTKQHGWVQTALQVLASMLWGQAIRLF